MLIFKASGRPLALVLLLWAGCAAASSQSQVSEPPIQIDIDHGAVAERIQAEIARRAKEGLSGAIIVEKNGAIVLESGFGWANRDTRSPFTTNTIAQIGSLTKQFTATAIVELSDQKKLRLVDTISKFFPQAPPVAAGITIQQLLTHTSGLPQDCGGDFDRVSRDDLISRCLAKAAESGKGHFLYSNLGYSVLAAITEKVTGERFEKYLHDRFFGPLRMNHTGYLFDPVFQKQLAVGYMDSKPQPPISNQLAGMDDSYWNLKGNGGLQSTVREMYQWYRALIQETRYGDTVRQQLMSVHARRDDGTAYGYGWFVRTGPDGQLEQVSHTGSDGIFYAAFVWRPQDRTFFYLVTNTGAKMGAEVASATLRNLRAGG